MNDGDRRRLTDMLRLAKHAVEVAKDLSGDELEADYTAFLAIVGALILLGEAAAQLSQDLRGAVPDMPWRQAKALRNMLVHRYFEIDPDQLVDTVRGRLPGLIIDLQAILLAED